MSLIHFLRVLNKNLNIFLLSSLSLAVIVFFVTRGLPETYQTRTEIFTGLISGTDLKDVEGGKTDFKMVHNQFENLITVVKSDQTLEEVGEMLLAQHLSLEAPKKEIIGDAAWEFFEESVPQDFKDSVYVENSMDQTIANIQEVKDIKYDSWLVKRLFESTSSPYSANAIRNNLSVKRIGGSDLVELSYKWTDPGICLHTLNIVNDVFTTKLFEIKLGQSNEVVDYFNKQVDHARQDLMVAEDSLASFRIEHKIINYNQQTENIASLQSVLEKEYQQELRVRAAAKAAVDQMSEKLKLNKKIIAFSQELLEKKKRLSDLNAQIAEMEIIYEDAAKLERLKSDAAKLKAELSDNVVRRYQYSKTTEGVSNKEVLQEWLNASIELDASEARLAVLANRSELFQKSYDEFSPLGAKLRRLERSVDMAERNYLQLSNNLNSAISKQQGETLSTGGLVVTVPPKFPLKPIQTKQLLLVLLAAVVGFVVPFGIVFIMEFLDNTIRTPERAEASTGMKVLGAYPEINPGSEYKNVDMQWLTGKAAGHIAQGLRHEHHRLDTLSHKKQTRTVLIFSTRTDEGKSFIVNLIGKELSALRKKVAIVTTKNWNGGTEGYDVFHYENNTQFLQTSSIDSIVTEPENYDYIFLHIQAVLTEPYPIELIENCDMAVCVVSAKRGWNKADQSALDDFKQVLKVSPRLVLNGVEPDYMDSVLGEIKKSRSALRSFLKGLVTLQFGNKGFSGSGGKVRRQPGKA